MPDKIEKKFCKNFKAWIEKNYYRKEHELAEKLNISSQQLNNIKHGRRHGSESWRRWAADQLGLDYDQLIGIAAQPDGSKDQDTSDGRYKEVPMYEDGRIVAGPGGFSFSKQKTPASTITIAMSELRGRGGHDIRALRVNDDSMWPRIPEGSIIFIDMDDRKFVDGKFYAVRSPAEGMPTAIIRRVRELEMTGGKANNFVLVSENQQFLPEVLDMGWDELVVGRVLSVWRHIEGAQFAVQHHQQTQKFESLEWLAGSIGHDLSNALTPILGYAEVALLEAGDNQELKQQLMQIVETGQKAQSIARRLIRFNRQKIRDFAPIDLNELLRNLKNTYLRPMLPDHIKLYTELENLLPEIEGDEGQIEQAIVNILNNAREAMPEGGGLVIRTSSAVLDASFAGIHDIAPGTYFLLSIEDTGMGMDADTLEHVFEPFYTQKKQKDYAGLGLSNAYGIVRQHRGVIKAESAPGKGSVFKVYLPFPGEAVDQEHVSRTDNGSAQGSAATILLVEDDVATNQMCRTFLSKNGYHVISAQSSKEALELAKQYPTSISLVIVDLILPDFNGKELYQRLAQQYPAIKILFMSGYAKSIVLHHNMLEPEARFIQKPFSAKELIAEVAKALEKQ